MDKKTQEKIQQLQMIEQNLQGMLMQKQNFQLQLMETETAMKELKSAKTAYKIIGNIMVNAKKEELENELEQRKETTELRIKTLEKQEKKMRDDAAQMQKEVLGEMKE